MKILNKDKTSKELAYNLITKFIPPYMIAFLRSTNCVVTGGLIRDFIRGKRPKDLDILAVCRSVDNLFFILSNYFDKKVEEFKVIKIYDGCYTLKLDNSLMYSNEVTPIINITFYIDRSDKLAERIVYDQFDFNINMLCLKITAGAEDTVELINGYNKGETTCSLINKIKKGVIEVNRVMPIWRIERTISRLTRFIKEGYKINSYEKDIFTEIIKNHL